MKSVAPSAAPPQKRRMILLASAVAAGLLFVVFANLHLVYVAVTSQPECVAHIRADVAPAKNGLFSAAKSAC
tara:strand:+ start:2442 stop:2657 length:216 start_codon:yes stop_codon:yes gene_type:complete